MALLWWDPVPVFCVKVTSVLCSSGFSALSEGQRLHPPVSMTLYPPSWAVLAMNQIVRRKSSITECQSYKTGFSFCVGLGFIAASNSSSRKQNFPILPFLVRQSVCGILPQRQEQDILWVYFLN